MNDSDDPTKHDGLSDGAAIEQSPRGEISPVMDTAVSALQRIQDPIGEIDQIIEH